MSKHRKPDPRTQATRAALIDEAEILFARVGIDGASPRQIGAAMGSGNNNVVAYHFGDKDALVVAIFQARLATIDRRRAELLREVDSQDRGDQPLALLDCLCRPLLEQVDRDGNHSFAAFIDGVLKAGRIPLRATIAGDYPATNTITERLAKLCGSSHGDQDFVTRLHLALAVMIATLQLIDREAESGIARAETLFAQALAMMLAALQARSAP